MSAPAGARGRAATVAAEKTARRAADRRDLPPLPAGNKVIAMAKKTNGPAELVGAGFRASPARPAAARGGAARPPAKSVEKPPVRTLGPVSDLERHLPSEWW